MRDVLAVALERRQPAMQSTLFHETSRLAFAAGELHDAAVLCGALQATRRGEAMDIDDVFGVIARCLDVEDP